jgi:hypothetical protein
MAGDDKKAEKKCEDLIDESESDEYQMGFLEALLTVIYLRTFLMKSKFSNDFQRC